MFTYMYIHSRNNLSPATATKILFKNGSAVFRSSGVKIRALRGLFLIKPVTGSGPAEQSVSLVELLCTSRSLTRLGR